jgi:hypothetical protein
VKCPRCNCNSFYLDMRKIAEFKFDQVASKSTSPLTAKNMQVLAHITNAMTEYTIPEFFD